MDKLGCYVSVETMMLWVEIVLLSAICLSINYLGWDAFGTAEFLLTCFRPSVHSFLQSISHRSFNPSFLSSIHQLSLLFSFFHLNFTYLTQSSSPFSSSISPSFTPFLFPFSSSIHYAYFSPFLSS